MTKTIFITGSTGFIGRNLVEQLQGKYHLLSPSHRQLDLTDQQRVSNYFKKHKINVVVHCANIGGKRNRNDRPETLSANLKIFLSLVRCQNYYQRLIFLGSGAEYDKDRNLTGVKEEEFGKFIPKDIYGLGKYLISNLIQTQDNMVSLRLFGVYGKYEDYKIRFISNIIYQLLTKKSITINRNAYFDYLYVDDLARIIDHFICHKAKYKFYNIGCGKRRSLLSIAKMILRTSGKKLPVKILKPGLNFEYTCDISRLQREIPRFRYTPFPESIKDLIDYYGAQRVNPGRTCLPAGRHPVPSRFIGIGTETDQC